MEYRHAGGHAPRAHYAGPVDPLLELAQTCWLNAKLHDDRVAELEGLPDVEVRAQQLHAMVDGYGLAKAERSGFVDKLIEFGVFATAAEAKDIRIDTPLEALDPQVPWALAGAGQGGCLAYRTPAGLATGAFLAKCLLVMRSYKDSSTPRCLRVCFQSAYASALWHWHRVSIVEYVKER